MVFSSQVSRCAGLYRETILDSNEKERAEKSCAMMPACRCSPASSPSAPLSLSRAALLTWKLEGLDCRNLAFGPGPLKNYHYLHKRAPLSAFAPLMIRMQAETAGGAVPQDPQSIPLMACFLQRNQMQKQLNASQRSSALSLQLSSACIQDSALVVPVELYVLF